MCYVNCLLGRGFKRKYQVLFSLKNNENKYSRPSSAAIMYGALRVKVEYDTAPYFSAFYKGK